MSRLMTRLGVVGALALLPALGGCVIYDVERGEQTTVHVGATQTTEHLESLLGVQFGSDQMTVVVASNGCTQASNFEVRIEDAATARISLARRELDQCKAVVPGGVSLSWSYEELGVTKGQAVQLLNPLIL